MYEKITHIIFDWDGTLMDSAGKIVHCMQKAAQLSSLPIPTKAKVENVIGISLLPAIQRVFAIDETKANEVQSHYKRIFIEEDQIPCPLFNNAENTLKYLAEKYTLGVATGKARRGLTRAFASTNTAHFFNSSYCADEAESKPSSDMLLKLLAKWGIDKSQALMIGDTTYDMQMAKQIDMQRIGVSYGVHDVEQISTFEPVTIIDDISELRNIL